ncbi:MAG TPA: T9SS type A sorting domain-containing protein, partial [Cytophagaceae bacterium]
NFSCTANKPILKVRAKASGICLLTATLVDVNGRAVDNYPGINMELTNSYQIFTIDFSQHFRNYHSANPGILDSTYIERIQFAINPGYYSYPYSGINANYNTAFNGTVEIDWIGIGDNCSPPLTQLPAITSFTPACITEGTQVTITGNYLSNANNVTFNGLAGTIISNTASQIVAAAPSGVTAGKISITTAEGSVTSEESFNLTPFADAGNDQNVSSYTATLTANAASGTWTLISGAGNIKNPNTPTTTVSALQNGANTFRWTVQNGSCTAYDEVTINASVTPLGNISGPTLVANGTQQTYSVTGTGPYTWIVPDGVVIVEGQGTNTIKVYFEEASGGNIEVVNEEGGISSSITITMDQPTSVHLGSDNYWQIFPNPFKESTLLRINSEQPQKLSIKVVDITGSSLYHSDNYFTNESIVIGNNLPNGIYILIINYNNSVKTFKLIKAE